MTKVVAGKASSNGKRGSPARGRSSSTSVESRRLELIAQMNAIISRREQDFPSQEVEWEGPAPESWRLKRDADVDAILVRLEEEFHSQEVEGKGLAGEINSALSALRKIEMRWFAGDKKSIRQRILSDTELGDNEGKVKLAIDAARFALFALGDCLQSHFELVDVWSVGQKGHPVDQLLRTQISYLFNAGLTRQGISDAFTRRGRKVELKTIDAQFHRAIGSGRNSIGRLDLEGPETVSPEMLANISAARAKRRQAPVPPPGTKRPSARKR